MSQPRILNDENNIIFQAVTKHTQAIRYLIEALREILKDATLKCTPKVTKVIEGEDKPKTVGGIYITAFNTNTNIFVRLYLEAEKFEYYKCEPNNQKGYINIGVNLSNLFKIIKFAENDDVLFLNYFKTNINQLNIQYVNQHKKLTSNYFLNLVDLHDDNIMIGKHVFDYVITMSSAEFHALIKKMCVLGESIDMKFVSDGTKYSLIFSCDDGDFASQISEFSGVMSQQGEGNIINVSNLSEKKEEKENENEKKNIVIQGKYELKTLSLFSRCSSICPVIELYIKNDAPLFIKYRVADLGTVHLVVSPKVNNDNLSDNNDEDDDESEEEHE